METLKGVAASPGRSAAPAWVHRAEELAIPRARIRDVEEETAALDAAVEAVAEELDRKAAATSGELSEVLEAQGMIARDPSLTAAASDSVRSAGDLSAAHAVVEAGKTYAAVLEQSESEYMRARAEDVLDVSKRIARRLLGASERDLGSLRHVAIVVAPDLAPAQMAEMDPDLVAGIVTEQGSRTSHTAIIARSLGIPAVLAVPGAVGLVAEGIVVVVDGDSGTVHVDPDDATRAAIEADTQQRAQRKEGLRAAAGPGPAATADGHRVELGANVGSIVELRTALDEGAEAVGLLRTELLYFNRSTPPSEDEQAKILGDMAEVMGDRRIVVRTFDYGADKPVAFIDLGEEINPALGIRGIRLARSHPDVILTQLRAVARAAAQGGRFAVMAPMVACVEEAEWFVDQLRAAGAEGVEAGVMVEVPSAILIADQLAERLDFLSIGTNDLTQYLHAADRQHGALADMQDPFSPTLLRAVSQICRGAGGRAWVGVCGEAAFHPAWALLAVGLGVTELSMGAQSLLEVKVALAGVELEDCRAAAERALAASDAKGARAIGEGLVPGSAHM
jgi:phosphoenolpyruvate-protein phosphotransferase (PTS system enzyme I)